jgi:murein DD-endopeptidase MepM/ murein hydrolase activator NlpD
VGAALHPLSGGRALATSRSFALCAAVARTPDDLLRHRLLLLCALALAPLALWGASPLVSSGAPSGPSLGQLQKKIDTTRGKIGKRKGTERVLTTDISGYSKRIDKLQGSISTLQARETRLQDDLDAKRAQLVRVQVQLRAERARLSRLKARLIVSRRALADRLVELYKTASPDLMTVILNSKGFADLLERGDFLKRISDADRQIVMAVKVARTDAAQTTQRLAGLEHSRQVVAAAILQRTQEVHAVKSQLIGTRVGYERTRSGKQAALQKVRSERQNLEGHLTALASAQQKIKNQLARIATDGGGGGALPSGPIKQGSGAMIWPVNGPITSPFCETRAWEACHPGIDIGVPSGTPIHAAMAGRVVLMQPESASGGYGNFSCVQHSASMSTCYAHQSSFATSMGAEVSQGDVIGYTGCTGRCFGPHLHFEVRINGSVTNPLNYL